MNILAIGAHPDDIELGCGGLMLKAVRQGHNVFMYTLTRGSASGDPNERSRELQESSAYIGVNAIWIDNFEDTRLTVSDELINRIERYIKRADADLVITHCLSDVHHDHKAIAASVLEAGRFVPNILAYEIPLTKDFKPQVFFDITDVVDDKIELIKLFRSQHDKIYLKANAIKGLAEYRALQSRLNGTLTRSSEEGTSYTEVYKYVESFEVLKMCVDKEFKLSRIPVNYSLNRNNVVKNEKSEILEFSRASL
jgi:LmbE family N-acetylglucosaminyl deacetylase